MAGAYVCVESRPAAPQCSGQNEAFLFARVGWGKKKIGATQHALVKTHHCTRDSNSPAQTLADRVLHQRTCFQAVRRMRCLATPATRCASPAANQAPLHFFEENPGRAAEHVPNVLHRRREPNTCIIV